MKKIIALSLIAVRLLTSAASAQTAPQMPGGPLAATNASGQLEVSTNINIPQSTSFTNAKVEVFLGAVMQGASTFNNTIEARYNFTPSFFVGAQIQNSPGASVINAASAYLGLRKAWDTTEVWAKMGGGRDWQLGAWKGEAWVGIAYAPFQDSSQNFLNKLSTYAEQGIILSQSSKQASTSTIGGITYHF